MAQFLSNEDEILETYDSSLSASKRVKHPIAVFFHIIFRSLAIVAYFMCSWVKNITGRLLAGLRWWNYVDDNGDNHWIFEAKRIITGVALSLNIANLYGFIRCKFGSNEKISNVAGSYIREQMFKTVLSKVSGGSEQQQPTTSSPGQQQSPSTAQQNRTIFGP
ncbi:unnamed protein product [Didymodactylos carnosus]|uniref:Golgi apparatus membrane protein TVP23 homolog n=1 Tax=Didymodactylos carnosus TaxID=1234261 RepID=A0A8S2F468_9BILA|nr:unnamed protein product [Didymodactylos carnosus]CAF4185090.1 unnamed protein product [Didymodactylos carnosus]